MAILQVGAEQFRRQLSELLNRVGYGNDEVIVERHNTPVAVLIPYQTYVELRGPGATEAVDASRQPNDSQRTVATVAREIRQTLDDAGADYQALVEGMQQERIRTLRENYPELYAIHLENQASPDDHTAAEPATVARLP